jgi:hypothetical protein
MFLILFLTIILSYNIINVDNYEFEHPHEKTIMIKNDNSNLGYINVRCPPYNATGDGITDDTLSIQRALDDVGNGGGGIVFVPEGNYLIESQLSIPNATVLKGVASNVQKFWGDPNKKTIVGTTLLAIANAGMKMVYLLFLYMVMLVELMVYKYFIQIKKFKILQLNIHGQ